MTRYLGSDALIRSYDRRACRLDRVVEHRASGYVDTIDGIPVLIGGPAQHDLSGQPAQHGVQAGGLRGFDVRDTDYVALWARDSTPLPPGARDIPVAVTSRCPRIRRGRVG